METTHSKRAKAQEKEEILAHKAKERKQDNEVPKLQKEDENNVENETEKISNKNTSNDKNKTTEKSNNDLYLYHHSVYGYARVGEEQRNENTGNLLCEVDVQIKDTNHHWDPILVIPIKLEFPLFEPDDSSDVDNEKENIPTDKSNNSNNQSKNNVSSGVIRSKDDLNKQHFDSMYCETIEWDLADPQTPSPMEFALEVAAQYGLNYYETLDLNKSIETQISSYIRKNAFFKRPITVNDPYGKKREISDKAMKYELEDFTSPQTNNKKERKNRKSAGGSTRGPRVNRERVPPVSRGNPRIGHTFQVSDKYRAEILRRVKEEFNVALSKIKVPNAYKWKAACTTEKGCHICHAKKPNGVMFSCGKHFYCEPHVMARLKVTGKEFCADREKYNFCPVCCLTCVCSKCLRKLDSVAGELEMRCIEVGKKPSEAEFDCLNIASGFIWSEEGLTKINPVQLKKRLSSDLIIPDSTPKRARRPNIKHDDDEYTAADDNISEKIINRRRARFTSGETPTSEKPLHNVVEVPRLPIISLRRAIVPSKYKMPKEAFPYEVFKDRDIDPSSNNDYNFVWGESGKIGILKNSDDPSNLCSIDYCFKCERGGNLICCDKCPRSFHTKCIQVSTSTLPDTWLCPHCIRDSQFDETNDVVKGANNRAIIGQFSKIAGVSRGSIDYTKKLKTVCKIHEIVLILLDYDFGSLFAQPVSLISVPDYKQWVDHPMDLGTVGERIINGRYVKEVFNVASGDNLNKEQLENLFQELFFNILKDIETIWHNCFMYNEVASMYHRMALVQRKKFMLLRKHNIDSDLKDETKERLLEVVRKFRADRLRRLAVKPLVSEFTVGLSDHKTGNYAHMFEVNQQTAGPSNNDIVAVLDPDTSVIVKMYKSKKSAVTAAMNIYSRGFPCEIEVEEFSVKTLKDFMKKNQKDPTLTLFGHRWLYYPDLLSGGKIEFSESSSTEKKKPRGRKPKSKVEKPGKDESKKESPVSKEPDNQMEEENSVIEPRVLNMFMELGSPGLSTDNTNSKSVDLIKQKAQKFEQMAQQFLSESKSKNNDNNNGGTLMVSPILVNRTNNPFQETAQPLSTNINQDIMNEQKNSAMSNENIGAVQNINSNQSQGDQGIVYSPIFDTNSIQNRASV